MKPYFEEDGITIYHGDCREVLPTLQHLTFDLLLTDPPYGIGVSSRTFGAGRINGGSGLRNIRGGSYQPKEFEKSDWDNVPADDALIEMARVACGSQVIWGGNYFRLPPSMRWLVWDKRNESNDFSDCELAWTNQDKAVRIFRYRWNGMLQEHGGRYKEERLHPAMKPLALMKWCLSFFPSAESILDPFMGSGTTLRAAKDLGRCAIGIEIHEPYCEIAAKRLAQKVLEFTP
jgi:DNA modification methylase